MRSEKLENRFEIKVHSFTFDMLVNQLVYKCYTMSGMRLIIVLRV